MRHRLPFVPFLLLATAACSYPRFAATKTVEFELAADGVQRIACETHNGPITIVGEVGIGVIRLHAEITARAASQADADALLARLDVRRDLQDGRLTVAGIAPSDVGWSQSTAFAFRITAPPAVAAATDSHNGALQVTGVDGAVDAETHNGDVTVTAATAELRATTHNGDLHVVLDGAVRDVAVETHNGEVALELRAPSGAEVEVATHNGSIRRGERVVTIDEGRRSFRGRVGEGKGKVRVTTHNGDVLVR